MTISSPKKIVLLVFGTRPEAIKMAPLVKEFQKYPALFDTKVCVTAQHRQMLDQVLQLFEIIPDYDLNIMQAGQDLYDVTARVLLGMRSVLKEVKPDVVLVHGDTTTSTAAALASFYQQIAVGHIEAGLRTHNIYSPWPEEINRQMTSRIATFNFAPTQLSKENLLNENIQKESIFITGNTVIDALYWVIDKMKKDLQLDEKVSQQLIDFGLPAEKLNFWKNGAISSGQSRKLVLITGHRRENFGDGFLHICKAIKTLGEQYPDIDFVYPMHLNPNVRNPIAQIFGNIQSLSVPDSDRGSNPLTNVYFIEPLDYLPFVYLMNLSYLILTDSGGIQEEAPSLGKPVLVMRDTTERPEALEAGTVQLVGTDQDKIIAEVTALIRNQTAYLKISQASNPYGDGNACKRIVEAFR